MRQKPGGGKLGSADEIEAAGGELIRQKRREVAAAARRPGQFVKIGEPLCGGGGEERESFQGRGRVFQTARITGVSHQAGSVKFLTFYWYI